jgi:hypothetical protein
MKILKHIPLFLYVLILYNIFVFSAGGESRDTVLNYVLLDVRLISGSSLVIDINDLLIIIGVIALYIEAVKATRSTRLAIIDHTLSLLVFVLFLIEFFMVRNAGTSSFLILTLMSLLDVVAGFTISITAARRDISFGG